MGREIGRVLKHDADVAGGVQHAASVDGEPDPDMDRMSGLAHQHGIAFTGSIHELPALPFGVIAEAGEHGAQCSSPTLVGQIEVIG